MLNTGFDAHKRIQSRKRQFDDTGSKAARKTLAQHGFERASLTLADAGYNSEPLADWTRQHCG